MHTLILYGRKTIPIADDQKSIENTLVSGAYFRCELKDSGILRAPNSQKNYIIC